MNRRKETEGGSPALRTRTKNYYSMGEEKSPEKWGKSPRPVPPHWETPQTPGPKGPGVCGKKETIQKGTGPRPADWQACPAAFCTGVAMETEVSGPLRGPGLGFPALDLSAASRRLSGKPCRPGRARHGMDQNWLSDHSTSMSGLLNSPNSSSLLGISSGRGRATQVVFM